MGNPCITDFYFGHGPIPVVDIGEFGEMGRYSGAALGGRHVHPFLIARGNRIETHLQLNMEKRSRQGKKRETDKQKTFQINQISIYKDPNLIKQEHTVHRSKYADKERRERLKNRKHL